MHLFWLYPEDLETPSIVDALCHIRLLPNLLLAGKMFNMEGTTKFL